MHAIALWMFHNRSPLAIVIIVIILAYHPHHWGQRSDFTLIDTHINSNTWPELKVVEILFWREFTDVQLEDLVERRSYEGLWEKVDTLGG